MLKLLKYAVVVSFLAIPAAVHAQGIFGGMERGAAQGGRAAGPVGSVVGGAVGGAVGGVNGASASTRGIITTGGLTARFIAITIIGTITITADKPAQFSQIIWLDRNA
jgi:hypothetical protein